jgi:Cu(I)/Ag(I) efflux system membrane fusion protein
MTKSVALIRSEVAGEGTSQMRRTSLAIAVVAAIALSYGLGRYNLRLQTGSTQGRHILYYVDPMHPSYKSDKPGIAPDCGMPLVPVYSDDSGNALPPSPMAQLPAGAVTIDAATQRLMGLRVAPVENTASTRTVRVNGRVAPEDTRVYKVNSGLDGFIRETYDDSVGMQVKKDQKLATFFSPDALAIASGFLAASERVPGAVGTDGNRTTVWAGAVSKQGVSSVQGYSDRLRNLGVSDVQLKEIADSRQLPEYIYVVAPADGFILARNISPGEHVDHEMEFYRVADLSRVWVIAEIFEQEAAYLRPGVFGQIDLKGEGRQLPARITDSLPQSEAVAGTVKVRLEVENPKFILRPDMVVDVELPIHVPPAVTVSADALIDSGAHARVYVEHGEGVFEPRAVETGWRIGDRVQILRGVLPGESVVVGATFLVDSESRIKSLASGPAPSPSADTQPAMTDHLRTAAN